jgi:hypothetical protein
MFGAALFAGLGLGPGAEAARGGIVVTTTKVREIADPTFLYTFTIVINDDCELQNGNFFTIFDIYDPPGDVLVPAHPPTAPSSDWNFLTASTGPSPFGPSPFDTALWNVAWLYDGPTVTGPFVVGEFTVTIEQPMPILPTLHFVSVCGPPGATLAEEGEVAVTVVPEPATFASAACGLVLLATGRWWRRGRRDRS